MWWERVAGAAGTTCPSPAFPLWEPVSAPQAKPSPLSCALSLPPPAHPKIMESACHKERGNRVGFVLMRLWPLTSLCSAGAVWDPQAGGTTGLRVGSSDLFRLGTPHPTMGTTQWPVVPWGGQQDTAVARRRPLPVTPGTTGKCGEQSEETTKHAEATLVISEHVGALLLYEAGSPTPVVRALGCILVGGLLRCRRCPVF